jgi:hypothetical protein
MRTINQNARFQRAMSWIIGYSDQGIAYAKLTILKNGIFKDVYINTHAVSFLYWRSIFSEICDPILNDLYFVRDFQDATLQDLISYRGLSK